MTNWSLKDIWIVLKIVLELVWDAVIVRLRKKVQTVKSVSGENED